MSVRMRLAALISRAAARKAGWKGPGLALLGLAVGVQSCIMIGPDYRTPPAPVASSWEQASDPGVDATREEYVDWWSVFNDPAMTRLITWTCPCPPGKWPPSTNETGYRCWCTKPRYATSL